MNNPATPGQPEYLQAWSLRCHPFEKRPDPQFFYAGSALMQRMDLLTHLLQFGESIVVVSGPPGSGKSSLLEQFLSHINPQWAICRVDGQQANRLPERLAETVGGTSDDGEQALVAHWAAHSDTSQQLILVIDNAERLDESMCRRLCELTALPESERMRMVLFGTAKTQQRIRETLEQLNSKRTCQVLEIPKLTEEETASYLMYRLAVAGYSGESPFTLTEVRAMCKAADGRPGKINRLAHESLIEHHVRAKYRKRAPLRRGSKKNIAPLWIGASITIAVVAGYLGWQRLAPSVDPAQSSAPPEQAMVDQPIALPAIPPPADDTNDGVVTQTEPRPPAQQVADAPTPRIGETVTHTPATAPTSGDPVASTTAMTLDIATPTELAAPVATTAPAVSIEPVTLPHQDKLPAGERTAAHSESVASPDSTTGEAMPAVMEKTSAVTQPAQPLPTSATDRPHREDWLLQQHPTTFTLQLLGSRKQSSIDAYIKRNALDPAITAYYRGRYRDAEWYVLLYGIYPDKAAARAARSALPDKVQKAKPWPRSLQSVQDSIREAQ